MVSSTFYDLRQIRTDLAHFVEDDLGYRALLSEHRAFPVDPDADTVENCRRRVEKDADIFVLVIGGRYGYVDTATSKSITNLEYLVARAKGIPIYAFVEKSVLAVLPVWMKNPQADFSDVVSDPRVFEFIQRIRSEDRVWMHEFEVAQEIILTLRVQFAYLMREGLHRRLQFREHDDYLLKGLHGKALRLALEQPDAWEYRLFAQVLTDEVEAVSELRYEHRLKIAFGPGEQVELNDTPRWMSARLAEIGRLSTALTGLLNENVQDALGPPGTAGDAAAIQLVAKKVAAIYRHAIEWSLRMRRAHVHECFQPVATEVSIFTDNMIEQIETYGPNLLRTIEEALADAQRGIPRTIEAIMTIDISNQERFEAALAQAERDCFS